MKNLQKALIAVIAGSVMTMSAQAAMNYTGQPYAGVKIGQYSPDDVDDNAVSYGVYGGYKFTPEFGIEAEYLTTGDADAFKDESGTSEYSADVYGLYATYDYMFPNTALYAKGRLGVAKNKIDVDDFNTDIDEEDESFSYSDTGISGGLGLGYNITPMATMEVMYNVYPTIDADGDDVDVNGFTLGAHFKF